MDKVNEFISRQPGDANHAAVRECALRAARARCLNSASEEANARALAEIEEFYGTQKRGE